jgi:hypothetical protein
MNSDKLLSENQLVGDSYGYALFRDLYEMKPYLTKLGACLLGGFLGCLFMAITILTS